MAFTPSRCLSPLHRANRQASIYIEDLLRDLKITAPEAHIVSFVGLYGPSSVGELVRVFGYRKPTMTGMLNRLENRGFISRGLNPGDRRSLLVDLTAAGRAVGGESLRRVQALDRRILEQVSEDDLRGFNRVLSTLAEITGAEVRTTRNARSANQTRE